MKSVKCIILLMLMLPMAVFADGFDDVIASMRYGNAGVVAKYFNSNVELTLLENEGVYSKQQAEIMLRNFFAQYPAKNIMIQHRGSSAQAAKYAIAIYEANNGKFRVYIFMKDSGAGLMIHELRIERE